MRLGIQHCGLGVNTEEMFRQVAEAGFSSIDYSLMPGYQNPMWQLSDEDLKEKMLAEKALMAKYGLVAGQTHAPMDASWRGDISTKEARWHAQVQAIKAASYLDSPYIVVHAMELPSRMNPEKYEAAKKVNMEFYKFLEPYAREYGVGIAIENLFTFDPILRRYVRTACSTAEDLMDYVDSLESDCFGVCLDVGHAFLLGQDPAEMIRKLGTKYIKVLHVHDNNGREDQHLMPGLGVMDWESIGRALYEIGYDGIFNYEANMPFEYYGAYKLGPATKILKVYAEFGKAITDPERYEK